MNRPASPPGAAGRLLAWYDGHRRDLPWRAPPGARPDPYGVWLSEIMLQQTTVAAVDGYFRRFLARWPTLPDLARAHLDEVLREWQGLGYYARARNLHKCARILVADHRGRFPETEKGLRALPGVGAYTAAAIAAIAFDRRATVVDGNVERVVARLFAVEDPLPGAKSALYRLADGLTSDRRPGDYAQAMMDLGATVCTPRSPDCGACPLSGDCAASRAGIAETLPRRAARAPRPTRYGTAFWAVRPDGAVLLRRRAESGLLGGMMEIPSTDWTEEPPRDGEALDRAPVEAEWRRLPGRVRHTFTHFHLELAVMAGHVGEGWREAHGVWVPVERLGEHALPTAMKKVVRHSLSHSAPTTGED